MIVYNNDVEVRTALRIAIERAGLSQTEAAAKAGLPLMTINRIINGKVKARTKTMGILRAALPGLNELLDGKD